MEEILKINVDKLVIWNDNPRHGNLNDDSLTEEDIINVLIEVVGIEKMYTLAKDIIKLHGLMGNVLPTVVKSDKGYLVYDGNRRISAIKFMFQPSLIEDEKFRKDIINLIDGINLDFLSSVTVLATDREHALELMDRTHGGEQKGAGVIPWDSFQKDISLSARNKKTVYPAAYSVATILSLKKKGDFVIPYTDLDRLFKSNYLKNYFNIKELSKVYIEQIRFAISELIEYKKEIGFNSYSRQFNITSAADEDESGKPIKSFCDWCSMRENGRLEYKIECSDVTTFIDDEEFDLSKLKIKVYNKDDEEVKYSSDDIHLQCISPISKKPTKFKIKIAGVWEVEISYKGVSKKILINVQTPLEPNVVFYEEKFKVKEGCSLDLAKTILVALDSHKNDMSKDVEIIPMSEGTKIQNGIFSGDNTKGQYKFRFRFNNNGKEHSFNKIVEVTDFSLPIKGESGKAYPFQFREYVRIRYSGAVAQLVNEINDLWSIKDTSNGQLIYPGCLCCSIRAVLEMSLDELSLNEICDFNNKNIKEKLETFTGYLANNKYNKLKEMCNRNSPLLDDTTEKNWLNSLNLTRIISVLNLGAHKSASRVDTNELLEICQKSISNLLVYIQLLIDMKGVQK